MPFIYLCLYGITSPTLQILQEEFAQTFVLSIHIFIFKFHERKHIALFTSQLKTIRNMKLPVILKKVIIQNRCSLYDYGKLSKVSFQQSF